MATMNISLPDKMKQWVEHQVSTGRYSNASDYVRALIRDDVDRNAKLQTLRHAIEEGIDSGISDRTARDVWNEALERHEGRRG